MLENANCKKSYIGKAIGITVANKDLIFAYNDIAGWLTFAQTESQIFNNY